MLSRFNNLILARVYGHQDILDLAQYASVPGQKDTFCNILRRMILTKTRATVVINALTDKHHPLQALADYLTIKEHFGKLKGLTLAWVGDGNNIIHDLMLAAPKLGVHVHVSTPIGYEMAPDIIEKAQELAQV